MARGCGLIVTFALLLTLFVKDGQVAADGGKLLIILMDGIRWDYLDQPDRPFEGFQRIARNGVRAQKMIPTYPTSSYPNYYSIMTGLYCESHGMIGNYMYDAVHDEKFLIGTNEDQYHGHWWEEGDPVWVTAARQGKKSHMYYWPGCEVKIRGVRPAFCQHYTGVPTMDDFRYAIAGSLAALKNGSADLAAIYFEETDSTGHNNGPDLAELDNVLRDVDREISKLLNQIDLLGLTNKVDVMIVSDHGMTEVSPSRVVNISHVITQADYDAIMDYGAMTGIWPKEGKLQEIYDLLKDFDTTHMNVYKKEEIPDRWHYKHNDKVAPITAVANLGWIILTPDEIVYPPKLKGAHGFDNAESDMAAIMYATGPSFRKGVVMEPFYNVELYQVMCHILGIQPSPHNGTWSHVEVMVSDTPTGGADRSDLGILGWMLLFQLAYLIML